MNLASSSGLSLNNVTANSNASNGFVLIVHKGMPGGQNGKSGYWDKPDSKWVHGFNPTANISKAQICEMIYFLLVSSVT